jgi:tripartite-type tricarboxylate transporter receptor subunit TctC
MLTLRQSLSSACAAIAIVTAPIALAQTPWPSKPIRIVVPFAPGGTSEVVARSVATELTKQLGVSVFVENKPGGAGVIAMQEVAKAAPDGYTLILTHVGTLAVNPYMLANQPYDVNKDFAPVTLLAKVPNIFAIHPDVPAKNLVEFVAYVKKNPGKLSYGSAGNASAGHLSMEYLKLETGMFALHIPYRGTGPQMTDLLAGRTQITATGAPAVSPHIRSGKLRAIAVGSATRMKSFPDVPTIAESSKALGLGDKLKNFETSQWYGLHVPAGTPPAIIKRLQEESLKALKSSAVTERFANDDAVSGGMPSAEYAAFIAKEQKIWKEIVKKASIKAD